MSGTRLAARIGRLRGEGADAWMVHELAVARRAQGEDIFLLSIGDPDFDTPAPIREAAVAALAAGRTHYPPAGGEPPLRAEIARQAAVQLGEPVSPEQVVVFPGAQAALFALAQVLFEEGDEVIALEPTYVTYEALLGAAGAALRQVPLRPDRGFRLDPDDLARAVTPRTRGLLLNFPHNPTGATLSLEDAAAVAEICRRHDLFLVSDEVYAALAWAGPHVSAAAAPGMPGRSAVVGSLSKSHAMTGWRCGWAVAPPRVAAALGTIARCMHFGVTQFVQDAAVTALTEGGAEVARLRDAYRSRAGVVVERLAQAPGITCRMPGAGMYVFADVRGTGLDGKQFARELLDATGVAVTPGEGFGPGGAGHVRITLGTSEERLAAACGRIAAFAAARAAPAVPVR